MNSKKYTAFYNVVYFFFYYLRTQKRENVLISDLKYILNIGKKLWKRNLNLKRVCGVQRLT